MIISASRRTDIPAFYSTWFMNRIRAGYCTVANPFNSRQVSRVSLDPEDVSVIAFWTRYARPLSPHLEELDTRGFRYYFLYTLLDYPRRLEPNGPAFGRAVDTFRRIAGHVGPQRVVWRYDPVVLGPGIDCAYHLRAFQRIARRLRGFTERCVVSVVDVYRKNRKRMGAFGGLPAPPRGGLPVDSGGLFAGMVGIARDNGISVTSCAEKVDLAPFGVLPGKCIDDAHIFRVFGIRVGGRKDPSQRGACRCVVSRDIGSYDTCRFGCRYCYATSSRAAAARNHAAHDPDSPSLLWHCAPAGPGGKSPAGRGGHSRVE